MLTAPIVATAIMRRVNAVVMMVRGVTTAANCGKAEGQTFDRTMRKDCVFILRTTIFKRFGISREN
jgi:hypothetical protein